MEANLVLEIGGGHNPSPVADVVVDKYLFDDTERGGPLKIVRPTVIADGEHLPFRDKAFARTVGRQVMEHMEDIGAFFEELMRVSSAGYLSAPSYLREYAFDWSYHRWLICNCDGVLTCAPKNTAPPATGLLFHYLAAHNAHFARFVKSLPVDVLHVQYNWEERIRYRVVDELDMPDFSTYEKIATYFDAREVQSTLSKSLKRRVLRRFPKRMLDWGNGARQALIGIRRAKLRRSVDLDSLLVCPACKQDVQRYEDHYGCKVCDRSYTIQDGVPIFLLDDASGSTVKKTGYQ